MINEGMDGLNFETGTLKVNFEAGGVAVQIVITVITICKPGNCFHRTHDGFPRASGPP